MPVAMGSVLHIPANPLPTLMSCEPETSGVGLVVLTNKHSLPCPSHQAGVSRAVTAREGTVN